MRILNRRGRLALATGGKALDVAEVSAGRFAADPQAVWPRWEEFADWARAVDASRGTAYGEEELGPPVPRPRQVLAAGLNYRDHAAEAGLPVPEHPPIFTKFPSCLTGPYGRVLLPSASCDWEVELVVVVGRESRHLATRDAWSHVAGLMVGQDLSERQVQLRPPVPQFSIGKSFPGFGPMGPALVTLDEIPNPDDLALECAIDGEVVQQSRTSQMIFPVPELIARLSSTLTLYPGDVIFTGTPPGVGMGRKPPRFLRAGEVLESTIEHVGTIRQTFVVDAPGGGHE